MNRSKTKDSSSSAATSSKWAKLSGIWRPSGSKSYPSEANVLSDTLPELQELRVCIQHMRPAFANPGQIESALEKFEKHGEICYNLCRSILQDDIAAPRRFSAADTIPLRRFPSDVSHSPAGTVFEQGSPHSGRGSRDIATTSDFRLGSATDQYLSSISDWKECLETLRDSLRTNLEETFKRYERDHSPEIIEKLFTKEQTKLRKKAISRMRNANVTRLLSADPDFFHRYGIRFRNYFSVQDELNKVRRLLQSGESGVSLSRPVKEVNISARGDSILEFANLGSEASDTDPVLRFRVSSTMLAETSPIFARMFSGQPQSAYLHEAEDISHDVPPSSASYVCEDDSEVQLFRMPQHELNRLGSLEVLLHAAHLNDDQVPRKISFEQFVAIAECSIRYRSTSPLEQIVEQLWLPHWMGCGADDMPDGLLIISYAFGCRELFARMSKKAVLGVLDEADLRSKPWPRKIRDKIWAVRSAKMEQVYACCANAYQEYLRPPVQDTKESHAARGATVGRQPPHKMARKKLALTSPPRCPRGDRACDAVTWGWLSIIFNEVNVMSRILQPWILSHVPTYEQPARSLAQMLEALGSIPSPPGLVHQNGVCDPTLAFRRAIGDISSSVTGLKLYDISGRSHGWGLSKRWTMQPEAEPHRMAPNPSGDRYSVMADFSDDIRCRILGQIDALDDLQAAAQVSKDFYRSYRTNKAKLLLKFTEHGSIQASSGGAKGGIVHVENKSLRKDAHLLQPARERPPAAGGGLSDHHSIENGTDSDGSESSSSWRDSIHHDGPTPSERSRQPARRRREGPPSSTSSSQQDERRTAAAPCADEDPMALERAANMLWPPTAPRDVSKAHVTTPGGDGDSREKFLASEVFFLKMDSQSLVHSNEKHLQTDAERYMGVKSKR